MNLLNKLKNLGSDSTGSSGHEVNWYITAEGAEGVKDDDSFSKSDAYLKIEFGGKSVRTRAIKNDRSPNWNETFHFKLRSDQSKDIHIKLMDDDIGFDDGIGSATISRGDLPMYSGEEKFLKIPIYRKDQASGIVRLRVKQIGEGQTVTTQQPIYQSSNVSSTSYPHQQQMPQQFSSGMQQPMPYGVSNNPNQQPCNTQYTQPSMNQPQQQSTQSQQQPFSTAPQYYGQHRY